MDSRGALAAISGRWTGVTLVVWLVGYDDRAPSRRRRYCGGFRGGLDLRRGCHCFLRRQTPLPPRLPSPTRTGESPLFHFGPGEGSYSAWEGVFVEKRLCVAGPLAPLLFQDKRISGATTGRLGPRLFPLWTSSNLVFSPPGRGGEIPDAYLRVRPVSRGSQIIGDLDWDDQY